MRAVVQRVSRASVTVAGSVTGEIGHGLLVLLGVSRDDSEADADYLIEKIIGLRIFSGGDGKMSLSVAEAGGSVLVVSQFTLYGDTRRGRRPSFIRAAVGECAEALYDYFAEEIKNRIGSVATGRFGAMMDVELLNDGPVTIIIDSEKTI